MSPLGEECNIHPLDLFAREAGALVTGPHHTSAPSHVRGQNKRTVRSHRTAPVWRTL